MERGDTGLGRDAYGQPRRQPSYAYGPDGPYPPADGYQAPFTEYEEEDETARAGEPVDVDDDYGQPTRP